GFGQRLQHHGLAIGLDRIGGPARKHRHEAAAVVLQHRGAKAIDRVVGAERKRGGAGVVELLQGSSPVSMARSLSAAQRGRKQRGEGGKGESRAPLPPRGGRLFSQATAAGFSQRNQLSGSRGGRPFPKPCGSAAQDMLASR